MAVCHQKNILGGLLWNVCKEDSGLVKIVASSGCKEASIADRKADGEARDEIT